MMGNLFRSEVNVEEFAFGEEDDFQGQSRWVQWMMGEAFQQMLTEAVNERNRLDLERWHARLDEATERFWNSGVVTYVTE